MWSCSRAEPFENLLLSAEPSKEPSFFPLHSEAVVWKGIAGKYSEMESDFLLLLILPCQDKWAAEEKEIFFGCVTLKLVQNFTVLKS